MPVKKISQRATRVGDQIQKELADLLRNEVKDPRVGPVTVTHVDVTSDLSHATVHFTHLAGREKAEETLAALARTSGFLRSALTVFAEEVRLHEAGGCSAISYEPVLPIPATSPDHKDDWS